MVIHHRIILAKTKKPDNMETLSVWELHKPTQCLLPSLSISPSVSIGHFHSVCSSTPSPFVRTTQRNHPICLDKKGLARRSFGNGLGLHQWLNWDASEDVSLALGRCSCRWRGYSFDQKEACFLFTQTFSLMSTWRDSEENLQYYFIHTLFPVVLRCQMNSIQSSCDSWTFPYSDICWVFYAHRWCIVTQALTNADIWKSLGECLKMRWCQTFSGYFEL